MLGVAFYYHVYEAASKGCNTATGKVLITKGIWVQVAA